MDKWMALESKPKQNTDDSMIHIWVCCTALHWLLLNNPNPLNHIILAHTFLKRCEIIHHSLPLVIKACGKPMKAIWAWHRKGYECVSGFKWIARWEPTTQDAQNERKYPKSTVYFENLDYFDMFFWLHFCYYVLKVKSPHLFIIYAPLSRNAGLKHVFIFRIERGFKHAIRMYGFFHVNQQYFLLYQFRMI